MILILEFIYTYTVDVYRYKTIESIGNSFVTFPKGILSVLPINALGKNSTQAFS